METKTKDLYEVPTTTVVEVNLEGNLLAVSNPPHWYDENM